MHTTFEVGNQEKHTVGVYWSLLGLEVYTVDGVEVLRLRSFSIRGRRKFTVGEQEKHEVEIVIDFAPTWKSWLWPGDWLAQAIIDNALTATDLTPRMRRINKWFQRVLLVVLLILGIAFGAFILLLLLDWVLELAVQWRRM